MSGRAWDLRFYGDSEVAGEIHSPAGANNGCTVLFGNGIWCHSISCQCMTIIGCISFIIRVTPIMDLAL